MTPVRRILLVLDSSLAQTPAVQRAVAVARAQQAELWLALFDRGPALGLLGALDRAQAQRLEDLMREQESARLEELRAQLARTHEITVHALDLRQRPSAQAILDCVRARHIDLLIKDVGHESALRRLVFLPLDWELLRESPVPVWIVGSQAGGLPHRLVAAVDPVQPVHGAGALNDRILHLARQLAGTHGYLRVFSAFVGLPSALTGLDPLGLSLSASHEALYEALRHDHREALFALLQRHALPADAATILYGPAAPALLDTLDSYRPELLIVGTVRRHGLDRALLGSTVERLVGDAPCDVLAVPAQADDLNPMHAVPDLDAAVSVAPSPPAQAHMHA